MAKPSATASIDPGNALFSAMTACWPLLEGSGSTSVDKTGNGYHLVLAEGAGAPVWAADGAGDPIVSMGTALAAPLDLVSDLTLPAAGAWSIAWRGRQAADTNNNGGVCGSDGSTSFVAMFGDAGYLGVRGQGGQDHQWSALTDFTVDANYVIVFDPDDGAGTIRAYKNGALVSGSPQSVSSIAMVIKRLGNCFAGTTFGLIGSLTYVYAWAGKALTAGEVASLHASPYQGLTDDPTIQIEPVRGEASRAITLHLSGHMTTWLSETPAGLFTVTGGTGASLGTVTILTDTSARVTLQPGTALGSLTITDTSSGAVASFEVVDAFSGGLLASSFVADASVIGDDTTGRTFVGLEPALRIRQHGPITRVRAHIGAVDGADGLRFKVLRPNGANFDVVAQSELLTPGGTGLQTFVLASPMACQPGDLIGFWVRGNNAISVKTASLSPSIRYAAGNATGTAWAPASSLNNFSLDIEYRCSKVDGIDTGDSRSAGHNGSPGYLTWYEGGPSGDLAAQPIHRLQALKDPTRASWRYQNYAKGSQTWAHLAGTQFPDIFTAHRLTPANIYTQCGVNDVATGRTNAAVLADLDTAYALLPSSTHWWIDEILPWTAGSDVQAAALRSMNAAIAAWASGKANVSIVSCHDQMGQVRGSTGLYDDMAAAYDSDEVHLTSAGVDALAQLRFLAASQFVGTAQEIETALGLIAAQGAVGSALESEVALGLIGGQGTVGTAQEYETAVGAAMGVGVAVEIETALGVGVAPGVGTAIEIETALALGAPPAAVGMAVETEVALGLSGSAVLATLTRSTMRTIPAGRKTPIHLQPLDAAEVDDLAFDFSKKLPTGDSVSSAVLTVEDRVGTDPAPVPLKVGMHQVQGALVLQRVSGALGLAGVTYLLRCEATLASGKKLLAAAFLPVTRQA